MHRIKTHVPHVAGRRADRVRREEDLADAVRYGADGYLLKNLQPDVLFQQLRGLAAGQAALSRALTGSHDAPAPAPTGEGQPAGAQPLPCGRSRRVKPGAGADGDGASNDVIARELGIAHNTVKNHLRSILSKLDVKNRAQAGRYAIWRGLVRCPAPSPPSCAADTLAHRSIGYRGRE